MQTKNITTNRLGKKKLEQILSKITISESDFNLHKL